MLESPFSQSQDDGPQQGRTVHGPAVFYYMSTETLPVERDSIKISIFIALCVLSPSVLSVSLQPH